MTDQEKEVRRWMCKYAWKFVGHPYIWGGNGSMPDCSGFACSILKAFGFLAQEEDHTADDLSKIFKRTRDLQPGDFVCYGSSEHVTHIEMFFSKRLNLTLGSIGGGLKTKTLKIANRQGAMVQLRKLGTRSDIICYITPFERNRT